MAKIGTVIHQGKTAKVVVTSFTTCAVIAADGTHIDTVCGELEAIEVVEILDAGGPYVPTWTDEMTEDFNSFYRLIAD